MKLKSLKSFDTLRQYPYFDRDISWLSFNYRVLMEAQNPQVPLLERLRFLAIYSSNLDEFFRVRVAYLRRLVIIGKKKINKHFDVPPKKIFREIHRQVDSQLETYGRTLDDVLKCLEEQGVRIVRDLSGINKTDRAKLEYYFKTKVLAFLQPRFIATDNPPFLNNYALYFALRLKNTQGEKTAVLNIPSEKLPRFYLIKGKKACSYYFLDDIIRLNMEKAFPGWDIIECASFKLNKDADLQIADEFSGDLVQKIEKQIKKRNLGDLTRFLYDQQFSEQLLTTFLHAYGFDRDDTVSGGRYHNLNDFFQIKNPTDQALEYEKLPPVRNQRIDRHTSIFQAIDHSDQILHFPYQSYDYILQFFNEAAIDPEVREINVTFYRMAKDSVIGDALISAAINGKRVKVFMEVKARFDEENNIRWATRMRKAGVRIQYSMPGLKVHAKVALVRKVHNGKSRYYGFFGTGNLNEKTARLYCDHGLLSSHPEMTKELAEVFKYLHRQKEPGPFHFLIVSQFGALQRFKALIDREIEHKLQGKTAKIYLKLNNLEEPELIHRLYEAAAAGVEVRLMVRGVCCLVPGTNGVEVSRIVDRYLEHARMLYFYNDGKEDLYMGSSDWMNRNLHRRIEVTFPVLEPSIRQQLFRILDFQFSDTERRMTLNHKLQNEPLKHAATPIRAQIDTYTYLKELSAEP